MNDFQSMDIYTPQSHPNIPESQQNVLLYCIFSIFIVNIHYHAFMDFVRQSILPLLQCIVEKRLDKIWHKIFIQKICESILPRYGFTHLGFQQKQNLGAQPSIPAVQQNLSNLRIMVQVFKSHIWQNIGIPRFPIKFWDYSLFINQFLKLGMLFTKESITIHGSMFSQTVC